MVMPGFQDAHVHPLAAGLLEMWCDLRPAADTAGYADLIRDYAARHPELPWIVGGGWYSAFFPGDEPTAAELDRIVPDRPVYLLGSDLHDAWVNSAALSAAGITAGTPDPAGGRIARTTGGAPAGTLHEAAADLVARHLPPLDDATVRQALLTAQRTLHRNGITAWQDALVGAYLGLPDPLPQYLELARRGELTGRVTLALWWDPARGPEQVPELRERRAAADSAGLSAGHVKIMQDGICENGWAALLSPYLDRAVTRPGRLSAGELTEAVVALDRAGFAVHFHAVGDRAVRECLDAVAVARRDPEARHGRHQIAHVQLVADADLPRFAELGVTAIVQPLWAAEIPGMRERYDKMIGPERTGRQYPFGSLLRAGAALAAGSDWPVSSPNPLWGAYVAATRLPALASAPWLGPGFTGVPFNPGERISGTEILHAYTSGSAQVTHGTAALTPGSPADLVVLDRDVVALGDESLGEAVVDLTIREGACVYDRRGEWT
ncbi:amidohydrolase [Actinoplanes lutulentus]|nr:amidohydrolase [Actinoplanes lutulentus]